jgi:hypothetical protein
MIHAYIHSGADEDGWGAAGTAIDHYVCEMHG